MKTLGNVYLLGDSYSTFGGWIPDGYYVYYQEHGDVQNGGLDTVRDTWWYPVVEKTDSHLVLNDSSSGTTVCYSNYNGEMTYDSAFVTRVRNELKDGVVRGKKIDTVLLFGATNDCWAGAPLGEEKYEGWTDEDFVSFKPSFCFLLHYLTQVNRGLRVICLVNDLTVGEYRDCMLNACRRYGVQTVLLHDVSKVNDHPDIGGMRAIADQVLAALE